jgi:hypothetical protein
MHGKYEQVNEPEPPEPTVWQDIVGIVKELIITKERHE